VTCTTKSDKLWPSHQLRIYTSFHSSSQWQPDDFYHRDSLRVDRTRAFISTLWRNGRTAAAAAAVLSRVRTLRNWTEEFSTTLDVPDFQFPPPMLSQDPRLQINISAASGRFLTAAQFCIQ